MTKKKSNGVLYKIFNVVVLIVPTSVYLFLSATILNINIAHEIYVAKDNTTIEYVLDREDSWFIYDTQDKAAFEGMVEWNSNVRHYGVRVSNGQVVKIGKIYKGANINADTGELELLDIKKFGLVKKESTSLPIAAIISIIGFVLGGLIISGKMKWLKKRKRLGAWVSLGLMTGLLFVMNMIVSNLLNVFLIMFVSWSIYCIGYLVKNGNVQEDRAEQLIGILNDFR